MKLITLISVLFLFGFVGSARAEGWDRTGWVKLGEREVNGRVDHDRIEVGKYEGKYTKLTLLVERGEIELLDFEVTFGNGEHWHPTVSFFFKEGARTRAIDLPGDERVIKNINLKYKNVGEGGRAKVEVFGLRADGPKPFSWDNNGWVMLGEREVNGRADHDRIEVGRRSGKFSKLTLVVLDGDLEMQDFEIKFGMGAPWHPALKHFFKEGQRTHVIDFPGDERTIKFVDFRYGNLPGGGRAKVQVWAK